MQNFLNNEFWNLDILYRYIIEILFIKIDLLIMQKKVLMPVCINNFFSLENELS